MIRTTRAGLGATFLLPFALVIAACGGGASTASTAPSAGGQSDAPSVDPGTSVDPNASVDLGAIPSFDLGALTGALPGVDSYRTSLSSGGVRSYESVVVTKPELSKAITTFEKDGTTVQSRIILIGKKAWQADGADGTFEEVPEQLASSMLMLYDPALMLGAYTQMDFGSLGLGADKGTESKNDVQARHLRIDATTFPTLAAAMPAGAGIDIWVAEAGYIVAWEMTGFGGDQDVAIEITNVNDPANKVDAP